jgi:acyl-CoA reductase-like NAD-dependent aldehyde dehydrogenase
VAAAKKALPAFSQTSKAERIAMLKRLHAAVLAQKDALRDATIEEYGGPVSRSTWVSQFAAQSFLDAATVLEGYEFERTAGTSNAYVFSSNSARAQAVARRLQAGRVAINGMQHDPLAPFGGYKQSGTGREFGLLGLESFLEAKAIMTLKV